jgi:hypothetical protein
VNSPLPERRYDFSRLLRVAHPEFSPAQLRRGWQALLEQRRARAQRSRGLPWLLFCALAPLGALFGGIHIGRSLAEKPLTYSTSGGVVGDDGRLRAEQERALSIRFADGSLLTLPSGSQGRLLSVNPAGARLRMIEGEVEANLGRGSESAWELDAGPYDVLASHASFWTRWREREQRFELGVRSGVVSVEGPLADEGLTLRAGQRLSIRKGDTAIVVRRSDDRDGLPAPAVSATALAEPPLEALGLEHLLAEGRFAEVVAAARAAGIEHSLHRAGSDDLLALAEAARSTKDTALSERALQSARSRFPGTLAAHDAAFLLGQLFESRPTAVAEAEAWYATYLGEAPEGKYAPEALGRRMLLALQRSGRDGALGLAHEYLDRYPAGAYAPSARAVLAL